MNRAMRSFVLGAATVSTALALAVPASSAVADQPTAGGLWSAAWGSAPQYPNPGWEAPNWSMDGFADQSVRQVVRVTAGGSQVRIRLTNRYGTRPLRVAGATLARAGQGAAIQPATLRPLTFGRRPSVVIAAGSEMISDAASLFVSPLESLTVTLYFAEPTGPATFHEGGLTTTYRAAGDHRWDRGAAAFTGETSHSWYYLAGVDVAGGTGRAHGTVVAFGDSITDGYGSVPNANNRYPDQLAERLVATGTPLGVVNAGINGNKLLADSPCIGEKGITRFRRDVLGQPGVRTVIVLLGLNDIGTGGFPNQGCGESPVMTAELIIEGYRSLIRSARAEGITIVGATLTPMKHAEGGYYTDEKEAVRDAVNQWIRCGGEYDAVVDFAAALADPADPDALYPAYDSGDHVHPNDAGRQAMADAIDLTALRPRNSK